MAYPNTSLTEYMFEHLDKFADHVALVELDNEKKVTYGELKTMIIKAAKGFQNLGVNKGDAVCIFSPNNIEYLVSFFALASLGAITQATNPLYTVEELQHQFEQCNTSYVVTIPALVSKVKDASNSNIKKIIVAGDESEGDVSFKSLLSSTENLELPKVTFDPKTTVACYIFSSGTTGLPKAVMLSHYNIIANLVQLKTLGVKEKDSLLVFLPFFHIYGLVAIAASALTMGARLVIMSRFIPDKFLSAIEKHHITVLHVVPPVMVLLVKRPDIKNFNLTSVQRLICGAAPLSMEIENAVKKILQISHINQGYGMSEVMITHFDTDDKHKVGSVGQPVDGVQHKIINTETGEDLGRNERGEVCIKGEQIMLGYLNQPEVTSAMIGEDGWARTGDVGYIDDDNFLFIVDRIKELIKYKGFQVAPAELEALLLKHPAIADVGVIGVLDDEAGELPKAFVVLKKEQKVTAEELENYVKEHAAPYKRLRGGVEFLEQIPKSASGKILRRVLRDRQKQ